MIILSVCVSSTCHLNGSYNVVTTFQQIIEERNLSNKVELKLVFCLGNCKKGKGVSVKIDDSEIYSVLEVTATKFFETEVLPKLNL
ncbi:(2Fe-2S) ferredoxin domain-containing protein [Oceanirhabdus sp. W0125-5]|uniref:(2Fe-2S) ferredoxin domain-containing protein n=1 Tax=Oceanirhabdus sp. W0125-5 TaxID=2999116 RepID=UPI0022F2EC3A|nr:(2Fe-2S) ferredoxin domain-containing protein [Oceanirhabdus sp. W0125-5]WBW96261.1 (2Fe-2S) ferredoxin domain-containing protein [Oceanirhabdus sp. W0125-5]